MEKKRGILHVVICVGLLCMIWGGYFLVKHYGTDRILEITEDDFSWVYQVDSVEKENDDFVIRGFAFELDKNAVEESFEIVLQDIDSGKKYFPKMEYTERQDVNDYFLCEYDYLKSGFCASIKAGRMDLEKGKYNVLLRISGEQKTYCTGIYICDGSLMYTNPKDYRELKVEGTDIEEIVENGVLRVYRPDFGVYVYQYDGYLYWIMEAGYGFIEDDTMVQYVLQTTQQEKLPQHRIEEQLDTDNRGFLFSKKEVLDVNTGEYRVAKEKLSVDYSVVRVRTGNYINSWEWIQDFRPHYQLEKQ